MGGEGRGVGGGGMLSLLKGGDIHGVGGGSTIQAISLFYNNNNKPLSYKPESEEWEIIDKDDEKSIVSLGFYDDDNFVFGSAPSQHEVQDALTSLHKFVDPASCSQSMKATAVDDLDKDEAEQTNSPTRYFGGVPSVSSEVDWMEPTAKQLSNPTPCGSDIVSNAFQLLQTEPSVQRMVVALSSDKAVWDAVMDNEVVRELRGSLNSADNNVDVTSTSICGADDLGAALDMWSWICINAKTKVMDFIGKLTKILDELFLLEGIKKTTEKAADHLEANVIASFSLSIIVFLIVVLTRANRA